MSNFLTVKEKDHMYNSLFTFTEYQTLLSNRKDPGVPGSDIIYIMLGHIHPSASVLMLDPYDRIWHTSFPSFLTTAIVIPIPKPGKAILESI